jgi:hypothetical protein
MRLLGAVVVALGLIATIILGSYVVRLRHDVDLLTRAMKEMTERETRSARVSPLGPDVAASGRMPAGWVALRQQPGVRANGASEASSAGPGALANDELRAQLRKLVAEELAEAREHERSRREADKDLKEQRARARVAGELELAPEESHSFEEVMLAASSRKRAIEELVKSGTKNPSDLSAEVDALRRQTHEALRVRLGEERLRRLQQLSESGKRGREIDVGPPWLRLFPVQDSQIPVSPSNHPG